MFDFLTGAPFWFVFIFITLLLLMVGAAAVAAVLYVYGKREQLDADTLNDSHDSVFHVWPDVRNERGGPR